MIASELMEAGRKVLEKFRDGSRGATLGDVARALELASKLGVADRLDLRPLDFNPFSYRHRLEGCHVLLGNSEKEGFLLTAAEPNLGYLRQLARPEHAHQRQGMDHRHQDQNQRNPIAHAPP